MAASSRLASGRRVTAEEGPGAQAGNQFRVTAVEGQHGRPASSTHDWAGLRSSAARWQMPAPLGTLNSRRAHEDPKSRGGSYCPTRVLGCP